MTQVSTPTNRHATISISPNSPVRADADGRSVYIARIDELRQEQTESIQPVVIQDSHPPEFAAFFVMVFVFGQIMSQWALFSGHYAAWIAGLVFSLLGITIALGSFVLILSDRKKTICELQHTRFPASSSTPEIPKAVLSNPGEYSRPDSAKVSA